MNNTIKKFLKDYDIDQIKKLHKAVNLDIPTEKFENKKFNSRQMYEIMLGQMEGIDVDMYANYDTHYNYMRKIRLKLVEIKEVNEDMYTVHNIELRTLKTTIDKSKGDK